MIAPDFQSMSSDARMQWNLSWTKLGTNDINPWYGRVESSCRYCGQSRPDEPLCCVHCGAPN